MMRRWMPPDYSTKQEEGLPHERLFTILCSVGNFKEYGKIIIPPYSIICIYHLIYSFLTPGVGRSKKLAKRQSAHKMVQKILTIPVEDETIFRNLEDDDEVTFIYQKFIHF